MPQHLEAGLSANQSVEKLADHFSSISQEFEPISPEKFPPWIKEKLHFGASDQTKPYLDEWQIYKGIAAAKKTKSVIPGDLPVKVVKEFSPELAKPISVIFNKITKSGEYPRQWVTEYQLPIPKVNPPMVEDDLRNISGTAFFSKVYESFIAKWLFPFIELFLDPGQCGGLKGSGITHYLVKLLHFIHSYLDKTEPHAVLLTLVDLEKAYNRVSHQLVIEDLATMHVPGWLLLILISYLTERSMIMRFNGASSSKRSLPGSCPQGAYLGVLLFIIIFNGILMRPAVPRPGSLNLKYIDDLSVVQALKLQSSLDLNTSSREFPLKFAERTGHCLPLVNNLMQRTLDELEAQTSQKLMKIKESKTHIMKFNFSRKYDFPPEIKIPGFEEILEVVNQTKLLGVIISDDLKWSENTSFICSKAYKRLWRLRRMKILDIDPTIILDVYIKEIRPLLEMGAPAWHSGLTMKQSAEIERVQKTAVRIILGATTDRRGISSYTNSLTILGIEKLEERRLRLCINFAKKSLKSRHKDMFQPNPSTQNTRNRKPYHEHHVNTVRAFQSPLVFLTRLLNSC